MQNSGQRSQSWLKLIVLLMYIFVICFMNIAGGGDDVAMNFDNPNTVLLLKVLQAVSVLLMFILPSLMFSIFWTHDRFRYLGVTAKTSIVTLFVAGTGMLLAMPLINWLAEINQHITLPESLSSIEEWMKHSEERLAELTDAFTKGTSVGVLLLNLFVIAFMAALSEELFFRGVLQQVLLECTRNKHIAVWLSAIIFSAFHLQFYGFIPRVLMGAYLGYLFLYSGSLWHSIFAHFVNNGAAVLIAWLVNRGAISQDIDKVGSLQEEWMYALISAVMVISSLVVVYYFEKKRFTVSGDSRK